MSAANLMVTRDQRIKLVEGYNLQIANVRIQDAGDYICQIGDQETRDQVHTLEILGMSKCLLYCNQSFSHSEVLFHNHSC